jgi:dihydroneopterin aldolase
MSDETRLAFSHPSERAAATAAADPLDRISLRDHIRDVEIGAFQAERGLRQRISFNLVVEVVPMGDHLDDDVDRILSYDTLIEAIEHELRAERLNLLETLAARVAERILRDRRAARVFVRIEKLDRGPFALGVEIVRSQTRAPVRVVAPEAVLRPQIVFLSNAAITDSDLPSLLDSFADVPTILCVGPGDTPAPQVGQPKAQRRVDLLAIEQNAWRLAARDARCVVVDSRTELDWGLKNGQLSVWAPSRVVLDATDAPGGADPLVLAGYCARIFDATRCLSIGAGSVAGAAHCDLAASVTHALALGSG